MVNAPAAAPPRARREESFRLLLADGRGASAFVDDRSAVLRLDGRDVLTLRRSAADVFEGEELADGRTCPAEAFLPLLAQVFSHPPRPSAFAATLAADRSWALDAVWRGVFDACEDLGQGRVRVSARRGNFWQNPLLWLPGGPSGPARVQATQISAAPRDENGHPVRPRKPLGEVYRRRMPRFDSDFSIRAFDVDADLATFNHWMNLDSVAEFWNQRGSIEEHRAYILRIGADPHMISMVGCFDDEPFAYFEIYWAKEDRIAPFYDVDDYDRGVHLLVGESKHQGPGKVEAWFRGLLHYMFLDDARTRRIVGDPRVDHVRWIEYMEKQGFLRLKEFDLPHKRSELVMIERTSFFAEPWGGPK
jgi:RimJ/RimL family protein N-acetyltransferase